MMKFLSKIFTTLGLIDYEDRYTIQKTPHGKWAIYDEDGLAVRTYSRRTDALRGAERSGLTLV